ncbi:DUF397 domain-containing protein [Streptomyces sp. NPDC006356]
MEEVRKLVERYGIMRAPARRRGGECVEVATCPHTIHIRDSKNPTGPRLAVSTAGWSAFLSGELVAERG